jgi:hypothetical protein
MPCESLQWYRPLVSGIRSWCVPSRARARASSAELLHQNIIRKTDFASEPLENFRSKVGFPDDVIVLLGSNGLNPYVFCVQFPWCEALGRQKLPRKRKHN